MNGSILTSFAFLRNLTYVDLSNNNFTRTITEDFGNVTKLEYFPEPTSHSPSSIRSVNLESTARNRQFCPSS
ncbi:hypothetical protein Pyn_07947 [Prunus yedoensis var. nudiflora]|uniref:LRR receptor-like serine/threonine-protein kinase n=1 Tax=Prunus yedoensis var. nudiflora TaxID=2094558 RepID=A0A314Z5W2_PRUYE|nr:hypothetical protein Pyn_07947 [Prunus yedoensis var. nudiflora]